MKVVRLWVPVLGLVAWASPVSADLLLQFTSDWAPAFQINEVGAGTGRAAFGNSATMDGERKDLGANPGIAKAQSQAASIPNMNSRGQADVVFQRTFKLPGDTDWSVTLAGLLIGNLSATSPGNGLTAQAAVQGEGLIQDSMGRGQADIGGANSVWFANLEPMQGTETLSILEALQTTVILHSGDYALSGTLETVARTDKAPVTAGQAKADFFHSLSIGVSATPIPGPASVVLILVGLSAGFFMLILRRRNEGQPQPTDARLTRVP